MKQRFCPVCDTKLGNGRFCPVCKKWVRHPVYMDGDFYLNESHPVNERDCEYHAIINGHKRYDNQTKESKNDKTKTTKARQRRQVSGSYAAKEKAVYQKKKRKKNGRLSLILLIVAAYIIVCAAIAISEHGGQIFSAIDQAVKGQGTPETEDYRYIEETAGYDEADGNVLAPGERCTGYGHFSAVKGEVSPLIEPWAADQGWTLSEVKDEVYEESVYDGGSMGEESPVTYWNSGQCFWFDTGGETEGYVEINYDTVSQEIHYINLGVTSREDCTALLILLESELEIPPSDVDMFLAAEPDEDGWIWMEGESCTILAGNGAGDGMWYGTIAPY